MGGRNRYVGHGLVEHLGIAIIFLAGVAWLATDGKIWPYYLGGALFGVGLIMLDRLLPPAGKGD